jgi:TIR domain
VFISHVSDETELAQWLKAQLDRDFLGMLDIFVSSDRPTIQAGRRWLDAVDEALTAADLQIVLCSHESVGRPWVNFEAGAVWLRGIPVVPVCHSGLDPDGLPVPLGLLQALPVGQAAGLAKLYDAVAGTLGLRTPNADLDALAREATDIEAQYALVARKVEIIQDPHVLCGATEQYSQPAFGFELDVGILERYFPGRVTVERRLTNERLMDLLTTGRFDIVHLVAPVDRACGDLIFDPVDPATGEPDHGADVMSPPALSTLLQDSQTRLVVLATCQALLLAVELAPLVNMAASDQDISGEDAAEWEECFYRLLAQGKSVHKAFDLTRQQRKTPIRAIRQKDVVFAVPTPATSSGEARQSLTR